MIKCKVPLTHSHKVEIYFDKPSMKIKRIEDLDTLANSMKSPAIVIAPEFVDYMSTIKQVANSPYKIIVAVDIDGKTFGANKILSAREFVQADGFEIGITANKKLREMRNEIKAINSFLVQSGMKFDVRWVINASNGEKYISDAIEAYKAEKPHNSTITIRGKGDVIHDIVKHCRKEIGVLKLAMKICAPLTDNLLTNDPNLKYLISVDDLM